MKYTSRADLLIAAGESIKMQEKFCIAPMCKYEGEIVPIGGNERQEGYYHFALGYGEYEFPLAVVEGKPVFVGDEMYWKSGSIYQAVKIHHKEDHFFVSNNLTVFPINEATWLPPKPKTVMVEMIVEDAATMLGVIEIYQEYCQSKESAKRVYGCLDKALKALEKA